MQVSISRLNGTVDQVDFDELVWQTMYTVLYFYPRDNTPGCSLQAQQFSALHDAFYQLGVQVFGVSKDSHNSHCRFSQKYNLRFELISDEKWLLHNHFGAVGEKTLYGKKYTWTIRSTYILDRHWNILHSWTNVKANGHAAVVLDWLHNALNW